MTIHFYLNLINPFSNNQSYILQNWKEFADDKFKFDENGRKFSEWKKTLWENEKLLVMSNFSFSQCFQKTGTADM